MVRTLTVTFFVAALAASGVYAAPLEARRKGHNKVAVQGADTANVQPQDATTANVGPTPTIAAAPASDPSIAALVAAASASASSVQAAAIAAAATADPGRSFASPEFEGQEAGLQLQIQLEEEAGDDAAAARDRATLSEINQDAGGGEYSPLAELSLTLEEIATPALIRCLASVFPHLQVLGLGHATYRLPSRAPLDVRDPAILEALKLFPHLLHLRICLNFLEREVNQWFKQQPAARWLLEDLPALQTVAFLWEQSWFRYGSDTVVWHQWSRSLLPSPPTPKPDPEPMVLPVILGPVQ
ncbi:hypothetical protein B0H19DRAFT_1256511 [Mycena capillaripes]|nr:hypothetical protein B0H19DRAFT_1256511 [Mycena capillaripes]